ncbi:MAG: MFS transporter [Gammaproteobacteria bacterium]
MLRLVFPILSLLVSVALLLAGGGLLSTLLAMRGGLEGFNELILGLIMSGYFVGFFLGTFVAPLLIRRVGHIRAFAFYAALAATTVLIYPLWVNAFAWTLLRVLTGLALVGLCTVIESWLNAQALPEQRSRVFAVYMVVSLLALAAGQLLLDLQPPRSFVLFSVVAILISLATLPVASTLLPQPVMPPAPRSNVFQISGRAPSAAIGAVLSGLMLGAFWGMGPVYALESGLDRSGIGLFMGITICGGAALQFPIGQLSDRGDRRTTLAAVSVTAALTALMAAVISPGPGLLLFAMFFVFGGLAFALYPLCVAHLLDQLPAESLLAGCSALLLLNGIGAALGPVIAGYLMHRFGPDSLPGLYALACGLLALVAAGRRLLTDRRLLFNRARFHPMLRTTPSALELLPEIPETPPEGYSP